MITTDVVRRLLAVAEVGRDPYAVAQAAGSLLGADAGDGAAAGFLVKAYGALKLMGAAQRVTGGAGGGGGVIAWGSRGRRFAANVRALAGRSAEGAALVEKAAGELSRYELHQAGDGNYQIWDLQGTGPLAWVGGLQDHKGAAAGVWAFDAKQMPMPYPLAFDGTGMGWLLMRVAETTERSFLNYSCALHVLEPDPVALAMVLHLHDWQGLIGHPRIRWWIGESAEAVEKVFMEGFEGSLPARVVRAPLRGRGALGVEGMIQALGERRKAERSADLKAIDAYYQGKDAGYWHRRWEEALSGRGEPLRVLGITSRYTTVLQYAMGELAEAVRVTPYCEMKVAIEGDDSSLELPGDALTASWKPDLIVQISRMRYENPAVPTAVPFLCWDQDNLSCMRTAGATASVCEPEGLTFVAGHGGLHGFVYLGWPVEKVMPCHLAAATRRYAARDVLAEEAAPYVCDFSYVSNAAEPAGALRDLHAKRFAGGAAAVFGAVCEAAMGAAGPDGKPWHESTVRGVILERARGMGVQLPEVTLQEMVMSGLLVADRAFRHETLGWVSDFCEKNGKTLKLYGKGWEGHPTLGVHAAGAAQQGEKLRLITVGTRINLQIIGTGLLHSRLLDGIAAGGFFMHRWTPNYEAELGVLPARAVVSRWVAERGVRTFAELDGVRDEGVAKAWASLRAAHEAQRGQGLSEEVILRGLATAAWLPHAVEAMPGLLEVGFGSKEEFGERAGRFLGDEGLRRRVAGELREQVERGFSYDARWSQFLGKMRAGLARSSHG